MAKQEKIAVKQVTEQFLHIHHYFKNVWADLNREKKKLKRCSWME